MKKRLSWLKLVFFFLLFLLVFLCLGGAYVSLQEDVKTAVERGRNEILSKPVILKIFSQDETRIIRLVPAYDDESGNRIFILPSGEKPVLGGFTLRPSKQD